MSAGAFGAIAHSSEAPAKLATPIAKTRDSPKMSPSDPPTRMSDPSVTRYALTTHCWVASPPPSSCWIEGSATLTTEPSTKAIDEPRMLATSVQRATAGSSGGAAPSALSMRRSYGRPSTCGGRAPPRPPPQPGGGGPCAGPPAARRGLGSGLGGPDAERDRDLLRCSPAPDGEGDLVARLAMRHRRGERVGARDRLAVEGGYYVADLQPGLGRRRAREDTRDPRAGGDVLDEDADVGVLHGAAADERLGDALRRVDRDGEADAGVVVRVALDLVVDPDHRVRRDVDQRSPGVAVVDRRVGLDRARDREAIRCGDGAVRGADDAGGQRLGEAERAPDCDHVLARLRRRRAAERKRVQLRGGNVDVDYGRVRRLVAADERRRCGRSVLEPDLDRVGTVDDVLGGEDVALGVDLEAGSLGFLLLRSARAPEGETARRAAGGGRLHGDVDDARRVLLVQLRERVDARRGRGRLCRHDDGRSIGRLGAVVGEGICAGTYCGADRERDDERKDAPQPRVGRTRVHLFWVSLHDCRFQSARFP